MFRKLKQFFCHHDWTCAAIEGIEPTAEQLLGLEGFKDYAKMYCRKCEYESKLNERL